MSETIHLSNETYSWLQNHQLNGETPVEVIKRLLLVVLTNDITDKPEITEDDRHKYNKYYDDTNSGYIR